MQLSLYFLPQHNFAIMQHMCSDLCHIHGMTHERMVLPCSLLARGPGHSIRRGTESPVLAQSVAV